MNKNHTCHSPPGGTIGTKKISGRRCYQVQGPPPLPDHHLILASWQHAVDEHLFKAQHTGQMIAFVGLNPFPSRRESANFQSRKLRIGDAQALRSGRRPRPSAAPFIDRQLDRLQESARGANLLETDKAQHFAEEALHVAQQLGDAARLVGGYMALGAALFFQGKITISTGLRDVRSDMQFPDWPGSHPGVQCQFYRTVLPLSLTAKTDPDFSQ